MSALRAKTEWSGGRRRPLLEFNADGNVVLGVDMGGTKLYGAISDIGGRILGEAIRERGGASGEECYDLLTDLIDELLEHPKDCGGGVCAASVSARRASRITVRAWSSGPTP